MTHEGTQRRLAAILAVDVVGYTRLIELDEAGTLAALKVRRTEVLAPLVAKHRGRIFKSMGDGVLIEFGSAVNALACAVELQKNMNDANARVPGERSIRLRIGINLGDVVVDGSDLFGDGVNVAVRLQALAEPGGICVSGKLREEIGRKLDVAFEDLGEQRLKHVTAPVRAFHVQIGAPSSPATAAHLPLPDKPSIAVLPFVNMSENPDQEYFADGITEDIITALAHFRWFFVIARNTTFAYKGTAIDVKKVARELGVRYILEGSVRRSAQAIRITAQLIDATTGNHIWAERYDRGLSDIFAIQDEITGRVAGAIEPELLKTESRRVASRPPEDMTAWDVVRQGMWYFHKVSRETHLKARELFRTAIRLDPQLPEGYIWLARASAGIVPYGWSDDPARDLQEGLHAALQAVRLDDKNPYSHYALAITSVYSGDLEQAKRAAEQAIELSPSFALGHLNLGMGRLFSGDAAGAIACLQHGLRLSPYDPQNFVWYRLLALAHVFAGEPHKAIEAATKGLKIRPDWRPNLETMAICFAAAGRLDDARRCAAQMRQVPVQSGDVFAPLRARNPQWSQRLQALLDRADSAG